MKKILVLVLFIAVFNGFGQTMENLKTQTQKMYQSSISMKFNEIMDLTYPKIFEIADRESLTKAMKEMFENEMMAISLIDTKPTFTYSDIKEIDGKKFSVIRFRNAMKMTLKDTDEEIIAAIKQGLESEKQFDKISFDKASNAFIVESNSIMIGVSDSSTKNQWNFVNYDNDKLFLMIFDKKIKTSLGL